MRKRFEVRAGLALVRAGLALVRAGLALVAVAIVGSGCGGLGGIAKQLPAQPGTVTTVRMGSPWGNQLLNRLGDTGTNTVIIEPDGRIIINPPAPGGTPGGGTRPTETPVIVPDSAGYPPLKFGDRGTLFWNEGAAAATTADIKPGTFYSVPLTLGEGLTNLISTDVRR